MNPVLVSVISLLIGVVIIVAYEIVWQRSRHD